MLQDLAQLVAAKQQRTIAVRHHTSRTSMSLERIFVFAGLQPVANGYRPIAAGPTGIALHGEAHVWQQHVWVHSSSIGTAALGVGRWCHEGQRCQRPTT